MIADGPEQLLKVTVLEIRNGTVRLGFEAADHLHVHRWEVWERICAASMPAIIFPISDVAQ
jgi:carbon storage regulator CsrA